MIDTYYLHVMAVTVFFIWGLNYAFKPKEIFGNAGDWMREHWPKWVVTPLFDCPYCMASVWGTLSFVWFLWGYPFEMWIIFVFCLTGIGAFIRPN